MKLPRGVWPYFLWQLPSWTVTLLILGSLMALVGLPVWAGALAFGLIVLKDVLLFPIMRETFQRSSLSLGRERLIGARGRAVEPLAPAGYVRVDGELWKAEAREAGAPIPAGSGVVVRDARGLTLIVEEEGRGAGGD